MKINELLLSELKKELMGKSQEVPKRSSWITYTDNGVIVAALVTEDQRKECAKFYKKYNTYYPGLVSHQVKPTENKTGIHCPSGSIGNFNNSRLENVYTGFFEADASLILTQHQIKISVLNSDNGIDVFEYVIDKALCYKPAAASTSEQVLNQFSKLLELSYLAE